MKNLQDTRIDNVYFLEKSCRKMYTIFSAVQRQRRKGDVMTSFGLAACSAICYHAGSSLTSVVRTHRPIHSYGLMVTSVTNSGNCPKKIVETYWHGFIKKDETQILTKDFLNRFWPGNLFERFLVALLVLWLEYTRVKTNRFCILNVHNLSSCSLVTTIMWF
jgi:hypothetical protein